MCSYLLDPVEVKSQKKKKGFFGFLSVFDLFFSMPGTQPHDRVIKALIDYKEILASPTQLHLHARVDQINLVYLTRNNCYLLRHCFKR